MSEKAKTVQVKFSANTAFNGKVHKKDAVAEVTEAEAKALIEAKHAAPAAPAKEEKK